ncbi:putative HTH transcriptional regulator [Methanocalculus sp. AMF5]|uniref:AlbA family DNA-binding domain-containing protein n=1 Tax=Methanocalculus sp. AMF5 TaxID=1198257 RepID=UPI0020A13525|nr:RNA-binding domain-containing protein [Methanocalculus sp. AMF5]MCP1663282.1 putative HTH transcriptional regulator [Methanocalculus sp. AMF5]
MNLPPSELITLPEGKTLESRRDVSTLKNILKTIVAFANTAGGRLFIGVEDGSREIVGVPEPLDSEDRLCNLIADSIAARRVPDVELVSIGDKTLLTVCVPPSGQQPLFVKREGYFHA